MENKDDTKRTRNIAKVLYSTLERETISQKLGKQTFRPRTAGLMGLYMMMDPFIQGPIIEIFKDYRVAQNIFGGGSDNESLILFLSYLTITTSAFFGAKNFMRNVRREFYRSNLESFLKGLDKESKSR